MSGFPNICQQPKSFSHPMPASVTKEESPPSSDPAEINEMDADDDDDDERSDTLNSPRDDGEHCKRPDSKRSRDDEEDLSRSERKRNREKSRRNALNDRLEALAALLYKIDPALKSGKGDQAIMNRVNLIQSAVQTLQRIHTENEDRKLAITDLTDGGSGKVGQISAPALPSAADTSEADFLAVVAARRQRAFMVEHQAILAGLGAGAGAFLGGRMDHLFGGPMGMGMGSPMMNPGFDILAAQRRMFAQSQGLGTQVLGGLPANNLGTKSQDARSTGV